MTTLRFRPEKGNLADTIPHFHGGEFHVFYLHGNIGKVPWEHLVTSDFIHWRELPPALVSDGPPESFDGFNMYTGCVVEHAGLWHIFYTGCNPGHPKHREFVCHATSPDGTAWTKRPEDAFTADGVHYDASQELDFRDPYIFWNEKESQWWMLLCARHAGDKAPATGLVVSTDLVHWEQRDPLCGGYAGTPECPDLFRIKDTWYLLISPCELTTNYRSAKSLTGPWTPAPGVPIDTPVMYAAKRAFDGVRHILTGWLRDFEPQTDHGDFRWGGTQCIPREVFEVVPGELGFRPVEEVRRAFSTKCYSQIGPRIYQGATELITVPNNYRLDLLLEMKAATTFSVGFRVGRGGYRLKLDAPAKKISFGNETKTFERKICLNFARVIRIEAFVFDSLIEVFVDDRMAFSTRAYDFLQGALELQADDEVILQELKVDTLPLPAT